jgi:hypothetical protein
MEQEKHRLNLWIKSNPGVNFSELDSGDYILVPSIIAELQMGNHKFQLDKSFFSKKESITIIIEKYIIIASVYKAIGELEESNKLNRWISDLQDLIERNSEDFENWKQIITN